MSRYILISGLLLLSVLTFSSYQMNSFSEFNSISELRENMFENVNMKKVITILNQIRSRDDIQLIAPLEELSDELKSKTDSIKQLKLHLVQSFYPLFLIEVKSVLIDLKMSRNNMNREEDRLEYLIKNIISNRCNDCYEKRSSLLISLRENLVRYTPKCLTQTHKKGVLMIATEAEVFNTNDGKKGEVLNAVFGYNKGFPMSFGIKYTDLEYDTDLDYMLYEVKFSKA